MEGAHTGPLKFHGLGNPYEVFSNFYGAELTIDGKTWPTVEHYFQAQKFAGIDESYIEQIRTCAAPKDAKRLGKTRKVQLRTDWEEVKYGIMVKALQAKFKQHEKLGKALLGTGDREIIEDAKEDFIWGCGKNGKGKNLLGKALMEVREWLRKQLAEEEKGKKE